MAVYSAVTGKMVTPDNIPAMLVGEHNGLTWFTHNGEGLGFIPAFLNAADERDAKTQLTEGYGFGWSDFKGFDMKYSPNVGHTMITYPDDLPLMEIGRTELRDEVVIVFEYAWVAVVQKDQSFVISCMN
jgi:hypothetical protein